jgi:L-lactate dehydrogenase complex protein LldF
MDDELQDTLRCIRCGACMNHCPVYVQVGGHAYGTVYPGPIGSVLEPQLMGIQQIGSLTSACSLCGACGEVCPVRIPLPKLINRLRAEAVNTGHSDTNVLGRGSLRKPGEGLVWKLWSGLYTSPRLYRLFMWLATRFRFLTPPRMGGWTKYRSAPKPAAQSLHELARQEGFDHE